MNAALAHRHRRHAPSVPAPCAAGRAGPAASRAGSRVGSLVGSSVTPLAGSLARSLVGSIPASPAESRAGSRAKSLARSRVVSLALSPARWLAKPLAMRAVSLAWRLAAALAVALALALAGAPAAQAAERAIDKQVDVPAPIEQVWGAWTTREGIVAFFAPDARIEARVGGAFQIYFDPGAPAGERGADDMRFLALQPRKMISFDWNAPPSLPEVRPQRTFVVVRFVPLDGKSTRVTLHHTGWGEGGEWDKAHAYFDRAWGFVLGNLKKRFEQGPLDWKPWLAQRERSRAAQAGSATAPAPAGAASRP